MSKQNSSQNNNILLQPRKTPNGVPPFGQIALDDFIPAIEKAIEIAKHRIEEIKNNPEEPDFENTIVALEICDEEASEIASVFSNQLYAVGGELHTLTETINPLLSRFSSDIALDADIFRKVKAVYDKKDTLDLTIEQRTLLQETYDGFVRSGANLPQDKKDRLRAISELLSVLGPNFMNNLNQSSEQFQLVLEKDDLEGLPDTLIDSAAHAADEEGMKGKYLFTLNIPVYLPFMQYSKRRDLREKYWRAFSNRGFGDEYDNRENVLEMIRLRHEKANLLGYDTLADLILEKRMVENRGNVHAFIDKLKKYYKPSARNDLERLREFAEKEDGLNDLKQWDIPYYTEKLRERLFDFTSEELRPYFSVENVMKGVFEHFERLFNLGFKENTEYPVWHDDVKVYDVFENDTVRFMGTLYVDLFPRKGKREGAWKTTYRDQGLFKGKSERPIVAIVCNFTKPSAEKPSLLTHDEVLTLFHEMGHATHALLSDVTYQSLSGTNVKWDFVELPSQLQENWCYEKETLDTFARHYQTDAPLPPELLEKLQKSKNFMAGWRGLRQTCITMLDMAWHTVDPQSVTSVEEFEDEAIKDVTLFQREGGPISTSFYHVFAGGYASGYYSYKWAEVLDADAFEAFTEKGLYDRETSGRFKSEILSKGGSQQPATLYKRFRGRDPDPEALFKREDLKGLEQKAA